jgi:hypothetical protein
VALVRYAAERFLYRLSRSPHAEHFILKGALLLATRVDRPYRPTRDIDFLEYGEASKGTLAKAIADIANTEVEDDGLLFDLKTLEVEEMCENQACGGLRVSAQRGFDLVEISVIEPEPGSANEPVDLRRPPRSNDRTCDPGAAQHPGDRHLGG